MIKKAGWVVARWEVISADNACDELASRIERPAIRQRIGFIYLGPGGAARIHGPKAEETAIGGPAEGIGDPPSGPRPRDR